MFSQFVALPVADAAARGVVPPGGRCFNAALDAFLNKQVTQHAQSGRLGSQHEPALASAAAAAAIADTTGEGGEDTSAGETGSGLIHEIPLPQLHSESRDGAYSYVRGFPCSLQPALRPLQAP